MVPHGSNKVLLRMLEHLTTLCMAHTVFERVIDRCSSVRGLGVQMVFVTEVVAGSLFNVLTHFEGVPGAGMEARAVSAWLSGDAQHCALVVSSHVVRHLPQCTGQLQCTGQRRPCITPQSLHACYGEMCVHACYGEMCVRACCGGMCARACCRDMCVHACCGEMCVCVFEHGLLC